MCCDIIVDRFYLNWFIKKESMQYVNTRVDLNSKELMVKFLE